MGLTAKGYPYPEPTDSVDVARDVKALAVAVDARTTRGYVTATTDANGIVNVPHGLPVTPTAVAVEFGGTSVAGVNSYITHRAPKAWMGATAFQVQFMRADNNTLFAFAALEFSWTAS